MNDTTALFGHRPKKKWGQHFLTDPRLLQRIVDVSGVTPNDHVVEIGPGKGALTRLLCKRAKHVTAVEIDPQLVEVLQAKYGHVDNLTLVQGDFLKCDVESLKRPGTATFKVVGNVPYNVSTPILFKLIDMRSHVDTATLTVQKEVADPVSAAPGTKAYGVLSVLVQYEAHAETRMYIPATAFRPKPKVASTVLQLDFGQPHARRNVNQELFKRVVKASFGTRRKMIKNALLGSPLVSLSAPSLATAMEKASIDPKIRAEKLDIDAFLDLTEAIDRGVCES